jgi:hypothetical protein
MIYTFKAKMGVASQYVKPSLLFETHICKI